MTSTGSSNEDFYLSIPPFFDFSSITEDRHFRAVPRDWFVLITDVKGSTKAIEAGRYKDVNRIGAATIVCARKGMGGRDFPYVFGGDGATLLTPPDRLKPVLAELSTLKRFSETNFGLGLRVGYIEAGELYDTGAKLELARFHLSNEKCVAIFRGGGLTEAEASIKGDEARYGVEASSKGSPDLDELSCRWKAVPASFGRSLAVLVMARSDDHPSTYRQVLAGFERLVAHGLEAANPVRRSAMTYRSWLSCVVDEARHFHSIWSLDFIEKAASITVAVLSLKWGLKLGFFDPVAYAASIPAHSDYRKFDDTLRMIIDCTPSQAEELGVFLESLYQSGDIFYGLHGSSESLITCFVQSTDPGGHIHFVDGGDGGYAMAAKQLKSQINEATDKNPLLMN